MWCVLCCTYIMLIFISPVYMLLQYSYHQCTCSTGACVVPLSWTVCEKPLCVCRRSCTTYMYPPPIEHRVTIHHRSDDFQFVATGSSRLCTSGPREECGLQTCIRPRSRYDSSISFPLLICALHPLFICFF
jgi:hypothetical protein